MVPVFGAEPLNEAGGRLASRCTVITLLHKELGRYVCNVACPYTLRKYHRKSGNPPYPHPRRLTVETLTDGAARI